jgi:predicted metal-dependent hydrolase
MIKIIKSKRKTISMTINKDLEVIVKAPFFVNNKTIEEFITKNSDWIAKKRESIVNQNQIIF